VISANQISAFQGSLETVSSELLVVLSGLSKKNYRINNRFIRQVINKTESDYQLGTVSRDRVIDLGPEFRCNHLLILNGYSLKYQSLKEAIKTATFKAVQTALAMGNKSICFVNDFPKSAEFSDCILEGLFLGSYSFTTYKNPSNNKKTIQWKDLEIKLLVNSTGLKSFNQSLKRASGICKGVNLSRQLMNEPSNIATTLYMVEQAKMLAKKYGFEIRVLKDKALKKEKCNGLLMVGAGGRTPPAMVILRHIPKKKSKKRVVLVGKGVCFDTGGVCIKPRDMWEMKTDMSGAATVLGIFNAIGELGCQTEVTGILCLAENGLDANAFRPGDIFEGKNGKQILVMDTDAEGRLVLSDGLCMAAEFNPTHILDFATLTRAVVVALGEKITGLFSNSPKMTKDLITASRNTGEAIWELPLFEEYRMQLETYQADIKNLGERWGGAITAALFLKEFVPEGAAWTHLDIAGTNFLQKPWKYFSEGGTGVCVRPVIQFLSN